MLSGAMAKVAEGLGDAGREEEDYWRQGCKRDMRVRGTMAPPDIWRFLVADRQVLEGVGAGVDFQIVRSLVMRVATIRIF